ncbi:DUF6980 family protein [Streptomyces sp. NPDC059618]|uniref:DUF6980 family protein n=1 Tax=Streptomyces sp. NPDC059618 TaxID=3346887 RepID=UPI00368412DC
MTAFDLFIWSVFLWMASSVWRMRALPLWRRGLPLALLAGGGACWLMAAPLDAIAPLAWLSTAACPALALASWGLSLFERRREGNATRAESGAPGTQLHCCETMTTNVNFHCDAHEDPYTCPDALVEFSARFQEYGLIIHDGGTSSVTIDFCPWCGHRLPESQRDRWFDELTAPGGKQRGTSPVDPR